MNNSKSINITLQEAKDMFAAGGNLAQLALSVYSEADINPDYEAPADEDDKPKYNIKTDLPMTWDGAVNIIGSLTRCGHILSTSTGNPTKNDSDWVNHLYVPFGWINDSCVSESFVHFSDLLTIMFAWWVVDNDWHPCFKNNNQDKWKICITDDNKIYVEKMKKNERCIVCFSSELLAEKFKFTFTELICNSKLFIY